MATDRQPNHNGVHRQTGRGGAHRVIDRGTHSSDRDSGTTTFEFFVGYAAQRSASRQKGSQTQNRRDRQASSPQVFINEVK